MADDDWDTDPSFVNVLSERERRMVGSKVHLDSQKAFLAEKGSLTELAQKSVDEAEEAKKKEYEEKAKFSRGYGGQYGIEPIRNPQTGEIIAQPDVPSVKK